jgi:hypothetical protein
LLCQRYRLSCSCNQLRIREKCLMGGLSSVFLSKFGTEDLIAGKCMHKFAFLFTGILSVTYGILIPIRPRYLHRLYGFYYDFSQIKWVAASFFVLLGIILIWFGIRAESRRYSKKLFICPRCQLPYDSNHLTRELCPLCGVQLEELEGFYERHPDLRESDRKDTEPKT